jgi:hypothetical protein
MRIIESISAAMGTLEERLEYNPNEMLDATLVSTTALNADPASQVGAALLAEIYRAKRPVAIRRPTASPESMADFDPKALVRVLDDTMPGRIKAISEAFLTSIADLFLQYGNSLENYAKVFSNKEVRRIVESSGLSEEFEELVSTTRKLIKAYMDVRQSMLSGKSFDRQKVSSMEWKVIDAESDLEEALMEDGVEISVQDENTLHRLVIDPAENVSKSATDLYLYLVGRDKEEEAMAVFTSQGKRSHGEAMIALVPHLEKMRSARFKKLFELTKPIDGHILDVHEKGKAKVNKIAKDAITQALKINEILELGVDPKLIKGTRIQGDVFDDIFHQFLYGFGVGRTTLSFDHREIRRPVGRLS